MGGDAPSRLAALRCPLVRVALWRRLQDQKRYASAIPWCVGVNRSVRRRRALQLLGIVSDRVEDNSSSHEETPRDDERNSSDLFRGRVGRCWVEGE